MSSRLTAGFSLDRQWHWLRGEMETTRKPALLGLCRVLADTHVLYAIIGGVALHFHQQEPRTTLDIDLAVRSRSEIPREALIAAGFRFSGAFEHSEKLARAGRHSDSIHR
jgi:hypothetical protein